ncbi:MAG: hypothetical protein M1538_03050, partial [Candidatus Marsarchaeota archaeon]|nr:hypothetical protein [Candidatus Marsarchaeota archaeon]
EGQSFIREELQHIISNQTSKVICVLIKVLKNKDLLKSIAEGTDNALQKYSPPEQEEISIAAIERLKELGYFDTDEGQAFLIRTASKKINNNNLYLALIQNIKNIKNESNFSFN